MQGRLLLLVNVDVAFLLNFLVDLAWLWATSQLAGVRIRLWRLLAAASVGAALAVSAYFPAGRWLLTLPGSIVGTLSLVATAFWPCQIGQAVRSTAFLVLVGGAMAGTVSLLGPRVPWVFTSWHVSGILIAAGIGLCLLGGRYLWEAAQERARMARGLHTVRVRVGEAVVEIPALVDTGNSLRDPISRLPVVVTEVEALTDLLPPEVLGAIVVGLDGLAGLTEPWAGRCRLIPYRAVGQPAGMLIAFQVDQVAVRRPGEVGWSPTSALVGAVAQQLHAEGLYRALLPPQLLDANEGTAEMVMGG